MIALTRPTRRAKGAIIVALLTAGAVFAVAGPATAADPEFFVVPGSPDGVQTAVEYDGALYLARDGATFEGITRYDGTTFTDLPGSPTGANGYVEFAGDLYFTAYLGFDYTLFRFDGTTFTPIATATAEGAVVYDGVLYFSGQDGADFGLFGFDGVTATLVPGSPLDPSGFAVVPGEGIVFGAWATDYTLWGFDGSTFYDYNTLLGPMTAPIFVSDLTPFSGDVFMQGYDAAADEYRLYRLEGSLAAPVALGVVGTVEGPRNMVVLGGQLYFNGSNDVTQLLHVFDGVTGDTTPVPGSPVSPDAGWVGSAGIAYFMAGDGPYPSVYGFDGTSFLYGPNEAFYPSGFLEFGGQLFFVADAGPDESSELWTYAVPAAPATVPAAVLPPTGIADAPLLAAGALLLVGSGGALLVVRRRRVVA
jgi:hypothetical protein